MDKIHTNSRYNPRTEDSLLTIQFTVAVYQAPLCTLSLPALVKTPPADDTTLEKSEEALPAVVVLTRSVLPDSLSADDTISSAPLHTPFSAGKFPRILLYLPLILILLAAVGTHIMWRYKKRVILPPPPPPLHPYDEALTALATLQESAYLNQRKIKAYVFALSEILKRYLGRTYKATIQESTSQEFLRWLAESNLSREMRSSLEKFISQTEPIKFADVGATTEELEELFQLVEDFIQTNHAEQLSALNPTEVDR